MSSINQSTSDRSNDIVFTGIGMITAHGYGFQSSLDALEKKHTRSSIDDYKIKNFNPAPYLTDRKVVKVVSPRDVLGLVAFEECVKAAGLRRDGMNRERIGLYVGAPPSSTVDNMNYAEAIEATRDSFGQIREAEFGKTFRSASPTTLLSGLPNNVLCYGSKTLDARGPNSNYTTLETSGHLSVIGASRAMRLGRLDCAIAGGFSAHTDSIILESLHRHKVLKGKCSGDSYQVTPFQSECGGGTIPADGAAFISMEFRGEAVARGVTPLATLLSGGTASEAQWPFTGAKDSSTLVGLMSDILARAGVHKDEIGLVAVSGSGVPHIDVVEKDAVTAFLASTEDLPPIICTTTAWGNLMEAGGIAEIGAMACYYKSRQIPSQVMVQMGKSCEFNPNKKTVGLVLRTSLSGEYTGLVVRF